MKNTTDEMKKAIESMTKTAKLIQEQAEYAKNLDEMSKRKALLACSLLAGNIIDIGEGY